MSIPLVQNNEKDSINTSIIAIKKNLERINSILGLVDSGSDIDTSEFVKKSDIVDVVQSGNMNPVTSNAVVPVDTVTSGDMHSVTSNAVAGAITGNTLYNPFFNNNDFAYNIDTIGASHRSYWSSSAGGNTTGTCPSYYGVVETIVGNDGVWKFQVAKETFSDTTYTRQNINNGGWTAWQKVTRLKEKQIRIDDTSGYSLENGVYVKTINNFFTDNGIDYSKVVNIRQVNNGNNLYPYFFIGFNASDILKVFKFANINNTYVDVKVYYE